MTDVITNCPNCSEELTKEDMATNIKYKNEHAIVVYECPHCSENYKISPYQYLKFKKGAIKKLDSFMEFEDLPTENASKFGLIFWLIPIAAIIYFVM